MKKFFWIGMLFLPMLALATGTKDATSSSADAEAAAIAAAAARSTSESEATAHGGTAGAEANNAITFTSPDDLTIRNTAAARPPSVYPTGTCRGGWSAGVGIPGFNVAGGAAPLDENCDARETARLFYEFGERTKAIMILCQQPAAMHIPGCAPAQDYLLEMKLLELDNAELARDYQELAEKHSADAARCETAKDKIILGKCGSK